MNEEKVEEKKKYGTFHVNKLIFNEAKIHSNIFHSIHSQCSGKHAHKQPNLFEFERSFAFYDT